MNTDTQLSFSTTTHNDAHASVYEQGTVLLFYKYVHIPYPKQILKWQHKICTELNLTGRVILAHEGINATLGGSTQNIALYRDIVSKYPLFDGIDFKESPGGAQCFPRLRIVVKKEIVTMGVDPEQVAAADGGVHLTPQQAHELMEKNPEDLVILDGRNYFEAQVGTFKNAVIPPVKHFREFPQYIDENNDQFKDKQVLMFCTGGIRCERASAYLKSKNVASQVYQIEGGIHRYTEQYPDGFFRGKNYVFDGRMSVKVNEDILGSCALCSMPYDEYVNCMNAVCNKHFIGCPACVKQYDHACSAECQELLRTHKVKRRPENHKVTI
jgi:predicted sulfurtransferase